ncbi:copper resistance protein [Escherichia coli]|nr:copper resistance protein [Escherichia coli]
MFHTIVSIKNDGHYFCRAGGNRPDGLNEPVTARCTRRWMMRLFFV